MQSSISKFKKNLHFFYCKCKFFTITYEISKETAIGSIDLLRHSEDNSETLRKNIAVKGGTTEAAINSFRKNDNMKKIVFSGVNSAYKRAIKLGKK